MHACTFWKPPKLPTCCPLLPCTGTVYFANNACHNIETVLPQQIVGQDLALTQLTESVCQHIAQKQPKKPLVISVHGPPGVGKTYTHWWLARALYNQQPALDLDCPGIHCRGYKVCAEESSLRTHTMLQLAQQASGLAVWHRGMNAAAVVDLGTSVLLHTPGTCPPVLRSLIAPASESKLKHVLEASCLHNTAAWSCKPGRLARHLVSVCWKQPSLPHSGHTIPTCPFHTM